MRAVVRIVAGLAVLGAVAMGGAAAFAATPDGGMGPHGLGVQPDATAIEYGLAVRPAEHGMHSNPTAVEYAVVQPDATAIEYGL